MVTIYNTILSATSQRHFSDGLGGVTFLSCNLFIYVVYTYTGAHEAPSLYSDNGAPTSSRPLRDLFPSQCRESCRRHRTGTGFGAWVGPRFLDSGRGKAASMSQLGGLVLMYPLFRE